MDARSLLLADLSDRRQPDTYINLAHSYAGVNARAMPIKDLLAHFRDIHHSGKDLNMQLLSKPMSDEARNLCSK
jgi:hypothetical protein